MCENCNKDCGSSKLNNLTSAYFILTERCNLKCKYCFVKQNARDMTLDIAMDSVAFLIKNAEECGDIPSIVFFGGEPLLRWDEIIVPITEYVRHEYKKPFNLSVTTNGTLLTEDKIKYLKDNGFSFLLSIDGNEKSQNFNRPYHNGRGSFDKLNNVLSYVTNYYPDLIFRGTIHHESVNTLYDSMVFAVDSGFKQSYFMPNIFGDWDDVSKAELTNQMRTFVDYWIDLFRAGIEFSYIPIQKIIHEIPAINRNISNDVKYIKTMKDGVGKCGLASSKFCAIGVDGLIWGCHEMPTNLGDDWIIGDIYSGVDNHKRRELVKKFNGDNFHAVGEHNCDKCGYSPICDGGCVANNYLINGDVNKMPEMYCFWCKLLFEEAKRMVTILGEERNELFKRYYMGCNHECR